MLKLSAKGLLRLLKWSKTELDQLRVQWKQSCTDNCNVCREAQDELLEKVHKEQEEKLVQVRVRFEETIRHEQLVTKEQMDIVAVRRKTEIERIYAKKSGCPEVAEKERQTCRHKLEVQIVNVREEMNVEIERVNTERETLVEQTRIEFEQKLEVIRRQE